jgi:hypothetical protein
MGSAYASRLRRVYLDDPQLRDSITGQIKITSRTDNLEETIAGNLEPSSEFATDDSTYALGRKKILKLFLFLLAYSPTSENLAV